jgi:hypothetical protein
MRKTLILAGALVAIATPALAVDPAKVAVMVAQMRADEQTAIEAADKAEAAEKLVLQAKGRIEAFQLADKVIEQTDIASEADSAWFDQCLALYGPAKWEICRELAPRLGHPGYPRPLVGFGCRRGLRQRGWL